MARGQPLLTRRHILAGVVLAVLLAAGVGALLIRAEHVTAGVEFNRLESDIAIKGYDPVAYFTDGQPVAGDGAYQARHDGALYWFASADHLAMFQAEPEAYVPAYGGYCSYGVRVGMKYDVDPTAFEIVDGQLYLQLDPGTRHVWLQDMYQNILIGDQVWQDIRQVDPAQLPL